VEERQVALDDQSSPVTPVAPATPPSRGKRMRSLPEHNGTSPQEVATTPQPPSLDSSPLSPTQPPTKRVRSSRSCPQTGSCLRLLTSSTACVGSY
jgi:hypothetical protein